MSASASFLAGFCACFALLVLVRVFRSHAAKRADKRAAARRDGAPVVGRGFVILPSSRFRLPRGFADEGLLRGLVEFAAILALMTALPWLFLGAGKPSPFHNAKPQTKTKTSADK